MNKFKKRLDSIRLHLALTCIYCTKYGLNIHSTFLRKLRGEYGQPITDKYNYIYKEMQKHDE